MKKLTPDQNNENALHTVRLRSSLERDFCGVEHADEW